MGNTLTTPHVSRWLLGSRAPWELAFRQQRLAQMRPASRIACGKGERGGHYTWPGPVSIWVKRMASWRRMAQVFIPPTHHEQWLLGSRPTA